MKVTLVATGFESDKKAADKKRAMEASEKRIEENTEDADSDIKDIIDMLNRGRK